MDNSKKNNPIGFHLEKITTEQFALMDDVFNDSDEEINMGVALKFGLDKENKVIASFVKVQFEQKEVPFLVIELSNHFGIEESAWNSFTGNKDKIVIPKGFAAHLVMLTIGTLRGVIHCKTENTEFNRFVLLTINVTEMIKNDVELPY